jgi:hypothetical protein
VIQIKDREPTLGHGAKVVAVSLDKVRLIVQLEGGYYWLFFSLAMCHEHHYPTSQLTLTIATGNAGNAAENQDMDFALGFVPDCG